MDPKDRRVKIHPEEMESLLNLKFSLDYRGTVSSYAEKYQQLGWVLQDMPPQDGAGLEVDPEDNPGIWDNHLWEPDLSGPKPNLGVLTGERSQLTVLEVAPGPGALVLDKSGEWRSQCIAVLETGREHHFYAWDPSIRSDPASFQATPEIKWFGEGQVVPLPPSDDPETGETWQWLSPPWEQSGPTPPVSPWQHFYSTTLPRRSIPGSAYPGRRFIAWCRLTNRCSRRYRLQTRRCITITREF